MTETPARPTILIVDDEDDVLDLLTVVFEKEGFRTLVAGDGKTALTLAYERTPDLILLDVMMPEMDGWQVLKALRVEERTARIPVAIVSARTEGRDKIIGLQEGAVSYIEKPFSPAAIVAEIRAILGKSA
jgi:DNA-binding response OmpR family regulator